MVEEEEQKEDKVDEEEMRGMRGRRMRIYLWTSLSTSLCQQVGWRMSHSWCEV